MKLEDQMFKQVSEWINSNQIKREFLKGKPFSEHKFNYWLKKYRNSNRHINAINGFKEIEISSVTKSDTSRTIEITTPSGYVIRIVEKC